MEQTTASAHGRCVKDWKWITPGNWLSHLDDAIHERDGRFDEFGQKLRDERRLPAEFTHGLSKSDAGIVAWDDVSSAPLDSNLVAESRKLEMRLFEKMGVYVRVPREHQKLNGGHLIGVWSVGVDKEMSHPGLQEPFDRSGFATYRDDFLRAAILPLEALRMILSYAASGVGSSPRQNMINDVRRTYFRFVLKRQETCT